MSIETENRSPYTDEMQIDIDIHRNFQSGDNWLFSQIEQSDRLRAHFAFSCGLNDF